MDGARGAAGLSGGGATVRQVREALAGARRLGRDEGPGSRSGELVAARAAAGLLEGGATVRQVREALDGARRLAPEAETPLAELRLVGPDPRIVGGADR